MKDNKILLTEIEDIEEEQFDTKDLSISNLLNELIKSEWDAIEDYNTAIMSIQDTDIKDRDKIIETIQDITKEEYVHVGQLQKVLQMIDIASHTIGDGEREAENDFGYQLTTTEGEE